MLIFITLWGDSVPNSCFVSNKQSLPACVKFYKIVQLLVAWPSLSSSNSAVPDSSWICSLSCCWSLLKLLSDDGCRNDGGRGFWNATTLLQNVVTMPAVQIMRAVSNSFKISQLTLSAFPCSCGLFMALVATPAMATVVSVEMLEPRALRSASNWTWLTQWGKELLWWSARCLQSVFKVKSAKCSLCYTSWGSAVWASLEEMASLCLGCVRLVSFPGVIAHRRKEKVAATQVALLKCALCEEQALPLA